MNPKIKTQWTTALRSGDYKQAEGVLRNGDTYCCLGVLCELGVAAGVVGREEWDAVEEDGYSHWYGTSQESCYLPTEVVDWSGLDSFSPKMSVDGKTEFLTALNDHGTPFSEIADLIDANL